MPGSCLVTLWLLVPAASWWPPDSSFVSGACCLVPGDPLTAACQSHSGPIHHWSFTRPQREVAKWELHTFWARDEPLTFPCCRQAPIPFSVKSLVANLKTKNWKIEKAKTADLGNCKGLATVTVMDLVKVMILVKTVPKFSRLMY